MTPSHANPPTSNPIPFVTVRHPSHTDPHLTRSQPSLAPTTQPPVHNNRVPDSSYSQLAVFPGCSVKPGQLRQIRNPAMPHTCHAPPGAELTCSKAFLLQTLLSLVGEPDRLGHGKPSPSPPTHHGPGNARGALSSDGTQGIFSAGPPPPPFPQKFFYSGLESEN